MPNYSQPQNTLTFDVAIICALKLENDAIEALFDATYDGDTYHKGDNDPNIYEYGRIGTLNVVLTLLPGMGKEHAASGSANFRTSFPDVQMCLLVGVCAGSARNKQDKAILLGDVIISTSLVQSDFGRQGKDGIVRKDTIDDNFGRPSKEIRALLKKLQTRKASTALRTNTTEALTTLIQDEPTWEYPGREYDVLFREDYDHKHYVARGCKACCRNGACETAGKDACDVSKCDPRQAMEREVNREDEFPFIHFGAFSSADQVIRSSTHRNAMNAADGVIGFEMEGAGVWDNFPTVIIKGVCDYADSHKNKKFQEYAAAAAAACSKAFLLEWERVRTPRGGHASAFSFSTPPVMNNSISIGTFNNTGKNNIIYGGTYNTSGSIYF
jgi:nucleoside phosphorylase